jgi:hypothetical protein
MKLQLKRIAFEETYTIGKLSIDGKHFCDTLEDKARPDGVKVFGETAIPHGTYKVIITYSNRFKRRLPLLVNVPMFEGIRIHPGNTSVDTHGCILVGNNSEIGKVTQSKYTFYNLFALLEKANSDIEIEVI